MIQYFPIVTGSLTVLGNINVSGSITTSGSITISGSITSASFATSASNATNAISASYANNLTVAGTLTAQTIVVQTITSSVDFVTGSTRFGSLSSNTMQVTGSMLVSGSGTFTGSISLGASSTFPVVGLLNRVSDTTLYTVAAASGFTLTDSSLNTMYNATPTSHTFNISNAAKMTINSSGYVGVGTSTPFSQLSLPSGTGWNGGLAWNYTTNNSSSKRWWINTDQIAYGDFRICTEITQSSGSISNASTLYERLYISNSGSVVLGLTSDFIGERLRVAGSTSANKPAIAITSANPNVSCPNGTATTVYSFPSYPRVMYYMVFVRFDTGTNANDYATYAIVAASSVGSKLMTVVNGSAVTLTLSGLNVQINQTSGATQNAVVSVIQIFANGGSD